MVPNTAHKGTVCHHCCGFLVTYNCENILNTPSQAKKSYLSASSQILACFIHSHNQGCTDPSFFSADTNFDNSTQVSADIDSQCNTSVLFFPLFRICTPHCLELIGIIFMAHPYLIPSIYCKY